MEEVVQTVGILVYGWIIVKLIKCFFELFS